MIKCLCLHNDGKYYEEYAYTLAEYKDLAKGSYNDIKGGYIDLYATFDIESSMVLNNARTLTKDTPQYDGFMYIWQFCIEGVVIFGRTWDQYQALLEYLTKFFELGEKRKLKIFVHNLSFEYVYIRDFSKFTKVFGYDNRSIIRAQNECFEYLCSYVLSNMNLAKLCQNMGCVHVKAKNDLDYSIIRTPTTPLTEIEYGYCFNDVRGLWEAIAKYLEFDTLATLPLTSTGFVRRDVRENTRKNKKYRKGFLKRKLNDELYQLFTEAFRGGNTASNRYATGYQIHNVKSKDMTSSYPNVLLRFPEYPVGNFIKWAVDDIDDLVYAHSKYCTIGRYTFTNIEIDPDATIPYIPFYKCSRVSEDLECYNGRVLHAAELTIALTNIDFDIINSMYKYDDVIVTDYYVAKKGYLADEIREKIYEYYLKKCTLKYDPDAWYEYMLAKAKLNSIYGLMAQKIIKDEWVLDANGDLVLSEEPKTLDDYYNSYNSFTEYQCGCFCTALARLMLQRGIDLVGADMIYCDTDSVKYQGDHDADFQRLNDEIRKTNNEYCTVKSDNGKDYTLGIWDDDGDYQTFITLGAKKYAYTDQEGKIHVTVSGLGKRDAAAELEAGKGLDDFRIGKVFTRSGRTVAQYNEHLGRHIINVNGEDIVSYSNIAIVPTTYTLGVTSTMLAQLLSYSDKLICYEDLD